jgi:hypothetical protein
MYVKYGNYSHEAGECAVSIFRDTEFSPDGVPFFRHNRWNIDGRLHAADSTALTTALAELVAAYSQHGQDLYLNYDDHSTLHYLLSSETIGGTRVVSGPSFPEGRGPEGGTYRNYSIAVEGTSQISNAGVLTWQETISWFGGGPLYVFLQTANGLPQKQLGAQSTPYEAEQSGSAVGFGSYPAIPAPIYPNDLEVNPAIMKGTPRRRGRSGGIQFVEFPISWSYKFKSVNGFATVNPTLPP